MSKRSIITLTSAESKRLIAKAISAMPSVQRAYKRGILSLQLSTSNAYIYEELTNCSIEKADYVCGYIFDAGGCVAHMPSGKTKEYYFEKGKEKYLEFPNESPVKILEKMRETDVLIKSGNILDRNNRVGVFVGEPDGTGGEWGIALPYVMSKGVQVIVPMTLNKSVNVDLEEVMQETGIYKIDHSKTHVIAGVLPVPGQVITEIQALEILTDVQALPVAMNGVGSGEGTVTLVLKGKKRNIDEAWALISIIKGELGLQIKPFCGTCKAIEREEGCKIKARDY